MGLVPVFSISLRTLAYANPVLLHVWVTLELVPMHTAVALVACIAIFAVSAWGQSPAPGLINVGVGSDTTPTVQIPTKTNPNAFKGVVTSVSGGDPTAVGPIKTTVNVPSTTTTTGGSFSLLDSGVPATTTITGGTSNVIGSGGGVSAATTTTTGGVTTVTSAAVGDPEIRAFDGNTFEFEGKPGSFYEALADDTHQVSVHLKVGVMYDHNGTYMQGVGMKAHDQAIIVTLDDDDCLQVTANNEVLQVPNDGSYSLNKTLGEVQTAVHLDWQLFRDKLGNSILISTETMTITVYLTEAGVKDEGGVEQPAYLNFEATLNQLPDHSLKGFMGESYNNVRASTARKLQAIEPAWTYSNNASEYELPRFFTI